MRKELLKEYAKIEEKYRALDEEKSILRAAILEDLQKNKLEKVESEYGNFTVAHKTTWKYTEAVTKLEEKVKITKDKEQKKGLAKAVQSEYLLYKVAKEE